MTTLRQRASDEWTSASSCRSRQKLDDVFVAEHETTVLTLERAGDAPTSDRHLIQWPFISYKHTYPTYIPTRLSASQSFSRPSRHVRRARICTAALLAKTDNFCCVASHLQPRNFGTERTEEERYHRLAQDFIRGYKF